MPGGAGAPFPNPPFGRGFSGRLPKKALSNGGLLRIAHSVPSSAILHQKTLKDLWCTKTCSNAESKMYRGGGVCGGKFSPWDISQRVYFARRPEFAAGNFAPTCCEPTSAWWWLLLFADASSHVHHPNSRGHTKLWESTTPTINKIRSGGKPCKLLFTVYAFFFCCWRV